jgi:Domain of unknown function (DUF4304)
MSSSKTEMERELKASVIPWLRERGFTGAFPHLRRSHQSAIDLLTFQFDRHGGGYVIEVARCPPEGIVTHWGKAIPARNAKAWDVHPSRRKRIQANDTSGTDGWFRFDISEPKQLAEITLQKLADEAFWADLGPSAPPDKLHLPR